MHLPSRQTPHPACLSGRFASALRRAPAHARRRRRNRHTLAAGNVIQTDAPQEIPLGDVTHERGDIRRMSFDAAGRMLSDTRALGRLEQQTTTYVRNADGLVTDITDPLGRTTRTEYAPKEIPLGDDARGNPASVTRLHNTAQALTWSTAWHPLFNQPASRTDPLGHTTNYTYDAKARLTRIEDPLGNRSDFTWTPDGRIQSLTRYNEGRPLLTTFTHDGPDLSSLSDPQGNATQNTWDGNGNLTAFTDAKGNLTSWTYDSRNRPLTKTDARLKVETYSYDAAGNLAFLTDRKGQVSGYQYDALHRRTQAGFGASSTLSPVYTSTASLTWDAANRLTQIVDSEAGTITRTYAPKEIPLGDDNRFDAITLETGPQGSVATTYYANGQRQSIDPTGGPAVTYTYDNANRLTGITQAAGTGPAEPATAQTVTLGYDMSNRRNSLTLPNGIRIATIWDRASQLYSLTYKKADGSLIGDLGYTYAPQEIPLGDDAAGQRTAISGSLAASGLPDSVSASSHDDNNRLTAWNGATLTWDDNGNLLSDGTRSYTWDARDRLIAVSGPVPASFAYDPLGRRKGKTLAGVTTRYLYDGANPIQEKQSGTVTANLLAGPNLDEWYARTSAGQTQTYLPDALGSTLKLTDSSQAIVASYTYAPQEIPLGDEPYGKATVSGTPGTNSLGYTGREDDGTGLYYYRARYYHPGIARFVSEDPIGLAGGANLMAYVGGDPVGNVDPTGEIAVVPIAVWFGQAAWGAYQGYQAAQAFNKAQCNNPPLNGSMNDGEGPTPGQNAARNAKTFSNGASAYGGGAAKALAGVAIASVTTKFGNPLAAALGFAAGAYVGSQQPCTCPAQ